jgi:hypothetical protein
MQVLPLGRRLFGLFFGFLLLQSGYAEPVAPPHQPPLSIYIVRTGEQLQAPHVLTYHMVEYAQQRGRWIYPDVGYYDEGHGDVRQWFVGVGAEIYRGEHATWTQELYFTQGTGSAAHHLRGLWVWPVLDLRFTPRLTSQTVVVPTVPLNRAEPWGFDVDRSKVEYALRPHLTAGAGYSSSKSGGSPWQNKPFVTATVSRWTGDWEFWVQRVPGGAQIQLRYQRVHPGF